MLSMNSDNVILNCIFKFGINLAAVSITQSAESQITVGWGFPPLFLAERKKKKPQQKEEKNS